MFLSIGYSACHWCHVMERESFENAEIAALLNRFFVSIKVDREERPDVDRVYMDCCVLRTGRGGWPLTVFMTPERKPFFAGTYFQPERFRAMVSGIGEAWQEDREEIEASAEKITRRLQGLHGGRSGGELVPALLSRAVTAIESSEDTARGGFGHRQKFPMPCTLLFLLRAWASPVRSRKVAAPRCWPACAAAASPSWLWPVKAATPSPSKPSSAWGQPASSPTPPCRRFSRD